jgi:hypothetical protein
MDVITKTSKVIRPKDYRKSDIVTEPYKIAREVFIHIAKDCLDRCMTMSSCFDSELTQFHEEGKIDDNVYAILSSSRNNILGYYRYRLELPTKKIKEMVININDIGTEIECAICMETHPKTDVLCIKACNHEFGKVCLTEWLQVKQQCPLCIGDATRVHGWRH